MQLQPTQKKQMKPTNGSEAPRNRRKHSIARVGFHYISPTFGKWIRITKDPEGSWNPFNTPPSRIEMEAFSDYYSDSFPRNLNLLTHKEFCGDFKIQFNGNPTDGWMLFPSCCLTEYQQWLETKEGALKTEGVKCPDGTALRTFIDRDFASSLATCLRTNACEELKKVFPVKPLEGGERVLWSDYLFRLFVFTFFPTLRALHNRPQHVLYVWLRPLRIISDVGPSGQRKGDKIDDNGQQPQAASDELCASMAIALLEHEIGQISDNEIELVVGVKLDQLSGMIHDLFTLDLWALHESASSEYSMAFKEDILRECCTVDISVLRSVNQFPKILSKLVSAPCDSCLQDIRAENCRKIPGFPRSKCKLFELVDPYGDKSIVTASRSFRNIIEDLERRIESFADSDNMKKQIQGIKALYLYSEPGSGKENIAKLCHLISKKAAEGNIAASCSEYERAPRSFVEINEAVGSYIASEIDPQRNQLSEEQRQKKITDKLRSVIIKEIQKNPFFSYKILNTGLITEGNISRILYGKESHAPLCEYGLLSLAHMLGGTAFLDEFNTLRPVQLGSQLLRVFEKPHEVILENGTSSLQLNLLVIIAGNLNLNGLLRAKFNPALVFRICRHQINVPPLRTRQEDIAVFILQRSLRYNHEVQTEGQDLEIRHIDRNGLRLLCNLPWETNYRGLSAFMESLLGQRHYHHITGGEIAFDEIVQCLNQEDLLSGQKNAPNEEAYYENNSFIQSR